MVSKGSFRPILLYAYGRASRLPKISAVGREQTIPFLHDEAIRGHLGFVGESFRVQMEKFVSRTAFLDNPHAWLVKSLVYYCYHS